MSCDLNELIAEVEAEFEGPKLVTGIIDEAGSSSFS
jgi:hypothetical protein